MIKIHFILVPMSVITDKRIGNKRFPGPPVVLLIKFQEILIRSPSKKVMIKIVTHHAIPAIKEAEPLIAMSLSFIFCGQIFIKYKCSKYK